MGQGHKYCDVTAGNAEHNVLVHTEAHWNTKTIFYRSGERRRHKLHYHLKWNLLLTVFSCYVSTPCT